MDAQNFGDDSDDLDERIKLIYELSYVVEGWIASQSTVDEDLESSYAMVMTCWRSQDIADSTS